MKFYFSFTKEINRHRRTKVEKKKINFPINNNNNNNNQFEYYLPIIIKWNINSQSKSNGILSTNQFVFQEEED